MNNLFIAQTHEELVEISNKILGEDNEAIFWSDYYDHILKNSPDGKDRDGESRIRLNVITGNTMRFLSGVEHLPDLLVLYSDLETSATTGKKPPLDLRVLFKKVYEVYTPHKDRFFESLVEEVSRQDGVVDLNSMGDIVSRVWKISF